jgi:hypothetical protein
MESALQVPENWYMDITFPVVKPNLSTFDELKCFHPSGLNSTEAYISLWVLSKGTYTSESLWDALPLKEPIHLVRIIAKILI